MENWLNQSDYMVKTPNVPSTCHYSMPPEWAMQEATWISWPKAPLTFEPETILPEVEKSFALLVKHLQKDQIVKIFVDSKEEKNKVHAFLKKHGVVDSNVKFMVQKTEDVWLRDYGPTFLLNKNGKAAVKWAYNGYGKYEDLALDSEVFEEPSLLGNTRIFKPGIVLEGGSIEVNGAGICLTTKQCLLNKSRNPQLTQAQIEEKLKGYLGVTKILWLNEGIVGDDTDGHVDDIARFVDENTIVHVKEEDAKDPNYPITGEIEADLKKMTDTHGKPFKLIALPMPKLMYYEGRPLPASYANFYIGNTVVLVPTFDDPNDARALGILQNCFKTRNVIGIPARAWIHGLGTIHCSTQQEPKTGLEN